jgi:branched-chain amino acid transport system permease protein
MSLNLLVGYTGLISIAQAGVYGVGAYVSALLALKLTNDLAIALVLSAVAGILVSLVVALPALRLTNEYFLIATLGFQSIIFSLFMNLDITGGRTGSTESPIPRSSASPSARPWGSFFWRLPLRSSAMRLPAA